MSALAWDERRWPIDAATDQTRARCHIYSALIQSCATDDVIIREHIREAYRLLGGDLADLDARNPGGAL